MSLKSWYKEKWVEVKTGTLCGWQKGEIRKCYSVCRPSRSVQSTTLTITTEMSSGEKSRFRKSKTSSKRINYNHKRRKRWHTTTPIGKMQKDLMAGLLCLALLLVLVLTPQQVNSSQEFSSPYDWKMTCDDFIMSKYSVLQDPHLDAQAKYKIISYLEQKVIGECTKSLS